MKKLTLGLTIFFGMFFLYPEISKAESKYDFVEYDVKTKTERIIPFDESMYEGMPDVLEANRPQGIPETRGIIGEDDRELVQDTRKFPYSAIAQLEYVDTDYSTIASGSLIQKDLFLTCAHAVWDKGFSTDKIIVPGRNSYWNKPFGEAKMEKIYILKEYMNNKHIGNDFALIKLDRPIGEKTGWLGLSHTNKAGEMFTVSGYPGDKNFYMYTESQPINERLRYKDGEYEFEKLGWDKDELFYLLDSVGGQSGSPVYDSNAQVSAVHTSGISSSQPIYNGGSRVSKEKFAMVNNIINQNQKDYVPIERMEIKPSKLTVAGGEVYQLKADIFPKNATYQSEVKWSSNNSWVSVDQSGNVRARSEASAKATITATSLDGLVTATCEVTIVPRRVPVASVQLEPKNVTLEKGEEQQLTATISPTNATNKDIQWSSSNEKIATVTAAGNVTAIAAGTATITATTEDGQKSAISKITIVDNLGVKWKWDESTQTVTFGSGEFPEKLYWGYNIQSHIESQSRLKGKKIKKIIFSEPVKLVSSGRDLFYNLSELESIEGGNLLNTSTVKNMSGMFMSLPKLRTVDVSNWDTSQVTDMSRMFEGAVALGQLDVSNWNTSQVTDMSQIFKRAVALGQLDVSNWNTSQVTKMSQMFVNASVLDHLNVSNWNVDKVTSMSELFNGTGIKKLDLTNWNTLSVKSMNKFLPSYLEELKLGKDIRFQGDTGLKELDKAPYSGYWTGAEGIPQTFNEFTDFLQQYDGTKSGEYVREKNGTNFGTAPWKWDESTQTVTFGSGEFPEKLYWGYNIHSHIESQSRLRGKKIKKIIFSEPVKLVSSGRDLFYNLSELESIEGGNLLNTSTVKNMSGMFMSLPKLKTVDVSNWDTSQVTDMSRMFEGAVALGRLDVSNWNTSQVTDMSQMFSRAVALGQLDVSNWNTSQVTKMYQMFVNASVLDHLNVSNWNVDKVTSMSELFNGTGIKKLDLTNWNTLSVKSMNKFLPSYLEELKLGKDIRFQGDTGLKELDKAPYSGYWTGAEGIPQTFNEFTDFLQQYDGTKSGEYVREKNGTNFGTAPWKWDESTQTVTFGSGEFPEKLYWGYNIQSHIESQSRLKGKKIKKIIFSEPVKLVSSGRDLFYNLSELESIEGGNLLNTSTVKNMSGMFMSLPKLRTVDVSNWDTSQVTNMSRMFEGAVALGQLDVSNWNTSQVTGMSQMFEGAALGQLDVSNWNTSQVTGMSRMFNGTGIKKLDLTNWNTLSVKSMNKFLPSYLEELKLGKDIRFQGDTGLKDLNKAPYSGRWIGSNGQTNPTVIYQTSTEFTQKYDGSQPGTYVRERIK